MREILISAGEASGDLHAAALVERLRAARPDVQVAGIGGRQMKAAGVQILADAPGVVGFVEVVRHIPSHWALLRRLRARMAAGGVSLVIAVDYGGFNLRLAAAARACGVPVLYYITPQVWASRPGRLRTMAQVITKAAVILPFEEALLRTHGIDATFVGHPLLDRARSLPTRTEARRRLGLAEDGELLALFPGSRAQEVARLGDGMTAVARILAERRPGLRVVVAAADGLDDAVRGIPYPAVRGASFDLLRAADVALCKSGTTTLQAAIAGCPGAIVYRVSPLTYAIARRLVRIDRIGLVNIVAGRMVLPEFVQDAFVPSTVADALERVIADGPARREALAALDAVRASLGEPGAAQRVADIALGLVA